MRIVILADSLALPRGQTWGDIPYEETYPYLLDRMLRKGYPEHQPVVHEHGARFRTILRVVEDWEDAVELRRADAAIVHVGIVDCAPRVLSPSERRMVARIRPAILRSAVVSLAHRMRRVSIRLRGERPYLTESEFREGVRNVVRRARAHGLRALVFVNMLVPTDELEHRSPGFQRNATRYNRILAEECRESGILVDLNDIAIQHGGVAAITVDGMHPNRKGHRLLAAALSAVLGHHFLQPPVLADG